MTAETPALLEKRLRIAARSWRQAMFEVGKILCEMAARGIPVDIVCRHVLLECFGMPMSTARVALRWARGDYGQGDQAEQIVAKVRASCLEHWTPETIIAVTTGKKRIYSPLENRIVEKTFDEMTPDEVRRNTCVNGFQPIGRNVKHPPEYRCVTAHCIEKDDKGGLYLVSKTDELVRMRIPKSLLNKLTRITQPTA